MTYFSDLNSLFKHLQDHVIPDVLNEEVFSVVTLTQSKKVHEYVYQAYSPFVYERRGWDGGLADPKNNIATFYYRNNSVEMLVQNITKGSNENMYIAPLVEYGHGYKGMYYQYTRNRDNTQHSYLRARPFTRETIKYLGRTGRHVDAFVRGLSRHGIKTY